MKPVFQSTFGFPGGDCFSAALASILEIPLADVPRFCDTRDPDEEWAPLVNDWLRPRGLYYLELLWSEYVESVISRSGGVYVLNGQSFRGEFNHSVVGLDGNVVHDPHSSGAGIRPSTEEHPWIIGLMIPLDPTKVRI